MIDSRKSTQQILREQQSSILYRSFKTYIEHKQIVFKTASSHSYRSPRRKQALADCVKYIELDSPSLKTITEIILNLESELFLILPDPYSRQYYESLSDLTRILHGAKEFKKLFIINQNQYELAHVL